MPAFNCFRIRVSPADTEQAERKLILERDHNPSLQADFAAADFSARVYVLGSRLHQPAWAPFVEQAGPGVSIASTGGPSAVILVRVGNSPTDPARTRIFAYTFGSLGRFLIRSDCYERGYGLRTALNLMYPRASGSQARLRAFDTTTHSSTTVRARTQATDLTDFETFGISTLRDVVQRANGVPDDANRWGGRIGGGDSLSFQREMPLLEIGELSRAIADAHRKNDYKRSFSWIDNIQPITDPSLIDSLREAVSLQLRARITGELALNPPEIIDWERVSGFRFHGDQRARGQNTHPIRAELRLDSYLGHLYSKGLLPGLSYERLRSYDVSAVDGNGEKYAQWPAWQCLTGEIHLNGASYLLDDGDFFQVAPDYLNELDDFVARIPPAKISLPAAAPGEWEGHYNLRAAVAGAVLCLDQKTVRADRRVTPVELCDLLTAARQFIHVKRSFGSAQLSHLFAQGAISAELVQSDDTFRKAAHDVITEQTADPAFGFLDAKSISTPDFEVVYAIIARWGATTNASRLPFFSKVNLREHTASLHARGFRVAFTPISVV